MSEAKKDRETETGPEKGEEGVRLFLGLPVSLPTVRKVSAAADELRGASQDPKAFRWVAPARYHVTVKFLGWTKEAAVEAIRDRVSAVVAETNPFELTIEGMGCFPNDEAARVVWAGVKEESGALAELAKTLDGEMSALGFEAETRPYRPHLTVARCKPPQDLSKTLERFTGRLFSKSSPKHLILYKTNVESGSSSYERIASWPLE